MALLAESKKKVKYGLDPQNTNWSKDDSKFGQRMMERMGWSKGKGLGANESGMTEHVKASYKWDQRGLGSTAKSADAWVAHQDEFNDILKMLNSGKEDETTKEKEKPTQYSDGQKRYYGRFSRGRVQTLRTTDDLDCIFGRRKTASEPTTPLNQSAVNSGDEDNDADLEDQTSDTKTEKSHGLTTVTSSTSVQDYFAQKMKELQARKAKAATSQDSTVTASAESTQNTSQPAVYGMVGFSYDDEDKANGQDVDQVTGKACRGWYEEWDGVKKDVDAGTIETDKKLKKKKKKKTKELEAEDVVPMTGGECDNDNFEMIEARSTGVDDKICIALETHSATNDEGKSKKKKKSKKSKDVSDDVAEACCNESVDNEGFNHVGAKETDNTAEDMGPSSSKKQKRKKEQDEDEERVSKRTKSDSFEVESNRKPGPHNSCEAERKVKKKKKKQDKKDWCDDLKKALRNKKNKWKSKKKNSVLFPGSNLEDIDGYGHIGNMEQHEVSDTMLTKPEELVKVGKSPDELKSKKSKKKKKKTS